MMNNKQQSPYRLFPIVAIVSLLIGSVIIVHNEGFFKAAFAQQSKNPTGSQTPSQSSEDVVKSLMSPKSLMESVINQTRNTNATNFAAKQILSKVNQTNSTAGMNGTNMNSTNSMNSVLQKLQNSNATNFATHAIMEALKR